MNFTITFNTTNNILTCSLQMVQTGWWLYSSKKFFFGSFPFLVMSSSSETTGVTASTEKLINYIGLQTIWNFIINWKKDDNLNMLKTIVKLVRIRNSLVNFFYLFSLNLENFPMKDNSKYRIFSLDLLVSISLGMFMIFLLKCDITDLSINLGGYSFFS